MRFQKKDRFTSADKYLESVAATCLHMHKELIHDNLVKISTGELSEEEGNKFFFYKQMYSDEPQYKLLRLVDEYNKASLDNKPDILFKVIVHVEKGDKYLKGIGRKTHDRELRLMADLMFSQEMAIGDIAQKLCKLEWHDYNDIDSLEKTLQRWKDKYETGLKD
ncbi:hypothetical protein N9731_00875 [Gammaproteobacteria bacterium]|nr:hypothetical protein [Gammaproteobacteria bacterium]